MEIYAGKQSELTVHLGSRVVHKLISIVTNRLEVEDQYIKATGTITENRSNHCPLQPYNDLNKPER
ncbi:hypothetical protein PR048_028394 [Dryococelus australis]|uniref:Uncharacterized protein n=1 Tax=Dryococelus australis TaxID=614101 RepID=A0ABQ9GAE9_9NEOP|nr:hypothetical protein PR048_028394 [Dryococelus australis]